MSTQESIPARRIFHSHIRTGKKTYSIYTRGDDIEVVEWITGDTKYKGPTSDLDHRERYRHIVEMLEHGSSDRPELTSEL